MADDLTADGARVVRAFATTLQGSRPSPAANTVTSPWSIVTALAMARVGAAGETAAEIDEVLGADQDSDLVAAIASLGRHITGLSGPTTNDSGGAAEVTIRSADALWLQAGYPVEPAFEARLLTHFQAAPRSVDFTSDTAAVRTRINDWTAEQTAGRIPDLLGREALDELTRLVLTDAVHVLAPWAKPFQLGQAEAFHLLDGSTCPVAMMAATSALSRRVERGWTGVTVPYAGRQLAMTLVLPDAGRFDEVDGAADVSGWLDGVGSSVGPVHLRMPPFELDSAHEMGSVLLAMGMPLAFDEDRADFSAMTKAERVHIGAVAHRATITVDEQGTEAAAATAVVMAGRAAYVKPEPPLEITLDRPFLFVLHDVEHRTPLFVGRVVDPR